ncbi:hypothetical protein T4A_7708 [Trichinella pseudospiralis]|uniref:Uncharacterized protein n=1 Tax=Trichinella pseudospiralis TaxID=6337 RepID=A0A0V1ENA7_TRIPS|nr:hypothetical protein T4A_7708 [Trichinella pseudospiralis]KRZ40771.1 hypothetical protein T4C_1313 [Trichinella pseudospiralis]
MRAFSFTETCVRISFLPKVSSTRVTGTGQSPELMTVQKKLLFNDNKYKTVDSGRACPWRAVDCRALIGRNLLSGHFTRPSLAVPGRSALKIHKHVFRIMQASLANDEKQHKRTNTVASLHGFKKTQLPAAPGKPDWTMVTTDYKTH